MAVFTHAATRESELARPVQAWFRTSPRACGDAAQGLKGGLRNTCSISKSLEEPRPSGLEIAVPGATDFRPFAIEISCTAADTPLPNLLGNTDCALARSIGKIPIFSNSIRLK